MKRRLSFTTVALAAAILLATAYAQVGRGGSQWLTAGGDAQRTSWIRTDALISLQAMSKPGFELQWKTKLENASRGKYGLGQGVSAPGVTLFIPMSLVTGSSNNVYAIDSDTGYLVWQRHFDAPMSAATDACPGGTTSAATRIVSVAPSPVTAAAQQGGGRGAEGYHSVLGEPGQGAPVEVRGGGPGPGRGGAQPAPGRGPGNPNAAGGPAAGAAPQGQRAGAPDAGRGAGQRGGRGPAEPPVPGAPADQFGGGGFGRPSGVVYMISSDGFLHVMGLMTGKDLQRPAPFVPADSRWSDPIAVNTTLYTSTSEVCGGASNAVWAIDLESADKSVVSWKSDAPLVGSLALTSEGALVAVTGPKIVTLDAKTLHVKGSSAATGSTFVSGSTIFKHGDSEIIAAALKNGHLFLLDAAEKPAFATDRDLGLDNGTATDSPATWQESGTPGTRWILLPTNDSVVALWLPETPGPPSPTRAWTASKLTAPATPIIVNGVVFVLEAGRGDSPAILHAFEGTTGKELWTSGKTMTAPAAPGSFWSAFGQVYVGTMDGTLYAFGFSDERR